MSTDNQNPKIVMKGWTRRDFLKYSVQLSLLAKAWATTSALAKPTYNIGFWRSQLSTTILLASELNASVAVGGGSGVMAVSELSSAIALGSSGDGIMGVSEFNTSVAAMNAPERRVSEIYICVIAKV